MDGALCDELLEEIFLRLPPSSSAAVSLVSKRFLRLSRSSTTHLSLRLSLTPPLSLSLSSFLSTFPRLSSLSLSPSYDPILLSAAATCPRLRILRLLSGPVSVSALVSLSFYCLGLVSLSISVPRGFRFEVLGLFGELKEVSVNFTNKPSVQLGLGFLNPNLSSTHFNSSPDNPSFNSSRGKAVLDSTQFNSSLDNRNLSSARFNSGLGNPNLSSTQFNSSHDNPNFNSSRGKAVLDSTQFNSSLYNRNLNSARFNSSLGNPNLSSTQFNSSRDYPNLSSTWFNSSRGKAVLDSTQFNSSLENPNFSSARFYSGHGNPNLNSTQFNSSRESSNSNCPQFNSGLGNPNFIFPELNSNIKNPGLNSSLRNLNPPSTRFSSRFKGHNFDVELQLESLTLSCIRNDEHYALSWLYKSCKKLKKLQFRACEGIGDDPSITSFISCIKNIQEVELRTCRMIIDVVLLKLAENNKSLKTLLVYDGGCREGLLRFIEQSICDLQKLDFRLPLDLDDRHLFAVAEKFRGLKSLRLQSCCLVTGEGIKAICLSVKDRLEELALINCDVAEKEPGLLTTLGQNLKKLKKLDLSYNETLVDKEFVSMIVSCGNLEELKLRGCRGLSNLALVSISKCCKKLEFVDIMYCCDIKAKDVEEFVSNLPRLRQLSVEENKLSDKVKNWR